MVASRHQRKGYFMSHTLQELSETVYLDVVDKILEELENLEYTSERCHSENLRYILTKLVQKTITGNVVYNQSDPPQIPSERTVDGWENDLQNQM